jgi:hypothetical protein
MKTILLLIFLLYRTSQEEVGIGLNVEVDNNLFKFFFNELKDDVKKILLK